jgi:tRNA nucleotidyltransferase (CCA-adding enzyme)
MKTYAVGGAVRDALMGRPVTDRDWVVVGAAPADMIRAGFKPVGRDFPVFLHPQTHEEYALARTERKTAPGYRGFVVHAAPDVTLEQDLGRRDLTINAIAQAEDGVLIDPFGGARDIAARVLRHVSPAFAEDPVRILRVARFAARWPEFTVAPETMALMRTMVDAGEADALVPERVMQELQRGLMEARPSRMLDVLFDCGLIARRHPELIADAARWQRTRNVLDQAAAVSRPWSVRFALIATAAASDFSRWLARVRVDADAAELARLLVELRNDLAAAPDAEAMLRLIERADGLRRPDRFELLLIAAHHLDAIEVECWRVARAVAAAVDAGAIAAALPSRDGAAIAAAVRSARLAEIAQRVR